MYEIFKSRSEFKVKVDQMAKIKCKMIMVQSAEWFISNSISWQKSINYVFVKKYLEDNGLWPWSKVGQSNQN